MDDTPVIGDERPLDSRGPKESGGRRAIAVAGAGVIAVALWAIGGGAGPDPTVVSTTVPTTLAPLPEVAAVGESTLEWAEVTGLDGVTRVLDVTEAPGGGFLLVALVEAESGDNVAVFRSELGTEWTRGLVLADHVGSDVSAVAVTVAGEALVAVSDAGSGYVLANPWMWRSTDGIMWRAEELTVPGGDSVGAIASAIVPIDDGVLIPGYATSRLDFEAVAADIPPDVMALVDAGVAVFGARDDFTVEVPPGVIVFSSDGRDVWPMTQGTDRAVAWRGPVSGPLAVSPWEVGAFLVRALNDGRLLGWSGDGPVLSDDQGETWTRADGDLEMVPWLSAPWLDGVVVAKPGQGGIERWNPDTGEVSGMSPTGLLDGKAVWQLVAGDAGIAALAGGVYRSGTSGTVVLDTDDGAEWSITSSMDLILRGEHRAVSMSLLGAIGRVEGDHLIVGFPDHELRLPVSEWVEAVEAAQGVPAREDTRLAHSPDGIDWSAALWEEIAGEGAPVQMLTAGDLLLVSSQGAESFEVWVGRPRR